jgi:glutamyl-tRNA reductase
MTAAPTSLGQIIVVGANHRSSSLALRDQLFVEDAAVPEFLARLRSRGLRQALVLSTCDRVEIWTVHPDPHWAADAVAGVFADKAGLSTDALDQQLYTHVGADAVRHCFAVTASLDSLIIGEPHILGQVKAVHRLARDADMAGPDLEALLQSAYAAAKKVRSDTHIGERPVSIAAAAVQFARDLHGDLDRCTALLVGAGDMGELVAEALQANGLTRLTVTAPRLARAESVARTLNAHVASYDTLADVLVEADIVLASLGSRHVAITAEQVTQALRKRRRKPMFLVDAGIPGDIEPAVNRIEGAFLYDLTDLERVALEGRATREAAARTAWGLLDEDLATFLKGRAARTAVPAIVALRDRFEKAREQALREAAGDADKATRLLIHRLLHDPSEVMKDIAGLGESGRVDWDQTEHTLRRLFRLDREG